jgi:hypothetical protein
MEPERKRLLIRPSSKLKNNIKMELEEEDINCIGAIQDNVLSGFLCIR